MVLEAIRYKHGKLSILNQLLLPHSVEFLEINSVQDGFDAIRSMKVRGAPAIALVGVLSLVVEMSQRSFSTNEELREYINASLSHLVESRPTAVNMQDAAVKLTSLAAQLTQGAASVDEFKDRMKATMEKMLEEDVQCNVQIGDHGADAMMKSAPGTQLTVLTHCNTGSLATGGYGTALGVIRSLAKKGALAHVFCTETRPYNQGARLTAFELVHDELPATLICDDMVAAAIKLKGINGVVVGADRVVSNGDTANKIGTYQIAVVAKHHGIPFYIAAPTTSIDFTKASGDAIIVEQRPASEMTSIQGIPIAAQGIQCWNPAFDVTPAELITGIITEHGVFQPSQLISKLKPLLHPLHPTAQ